MKFCDNTNFVITPILDGAKCGLYNTICLLCHHKFPIWSRTNDHSYLGNLWDFTLSMFADFEFLFHFFLRRPKSASVWVFSVGNICNHNYDVRLCPSINIQRPTFSYCIYVRDITKNVIYFS